MPFSTHIHPISVGFHYFRNGRIFLGYLSAISGTVFINRRHPAHTHLMLITSSQQSGTSRTTSSRILKLSETYTLTGQTVQMRSLYLAPVTSQIREAHIITENQHDIGRRSRLSHYRNSTQRKCARNIHKPIHNNNSLREILVYLHLNISQPLMKKLSLGKHK